AMDGESIGTVRGLERPGAAAAGGAGDEDDAVPTWENMERDYIRTVLRRTGGNRKRAAQLMGIPRTTLTSKIRRFGID
ncbi:sigma-54-dependent Fis family transcriptional regulator, partial [bacterium]|nr:sigma-54-dependent Fis family transcriptional regulator [bacterium]